MPNATVNRSPRSIARSPGLSSPSDARVAGGQHQVARQRHPVPAEQADGLALAHPGRESDEQVPDAVRGLARGVLERGELVDLVDHAQAVGGVDEQSASRSRPSRAAVSRRSSSTRNAGTSIVSGSAYVFQPMTPTRPSGADALVGEDLGQRPGPVARLAGQAEVLEQVAAHRQRRGAGHPVALVADQDGRLARRADDEQRLLEARVEAGQEREVRAVLAVRVDDEPVVARARRARTEPLGRSRIEAAGISGSAPGMPKSGRSIGASRAVVIVVCSLSPAASRAAVAPRRARWSRTGSRRAGSHGPSSPSGQ